MASAIGYLIDGSVDFRRDLAAILELDPEVVDQLADLRPDGPGDSAVGALAESRQLSLDTLLRCSAVMQWITTQAAVQEGPEDAIRDIRAGLRRHRLTERSDEDIERYFGWIARLVDDPTITTPLLVRAFREKLVGYRGAMFLARTQPVIDFRKRVIGYLPLIDMEIYGESGTSDRLVLERDDLITLQIQVGEALSIIDGLIADLGERSLDPQIGSEID